MLLRILCAMAALAMSIPSWASIPMQTKEVLLTVQFAGMRPAVLQLGGNDHLYSEVRIFVPRGDEEGIVAI